MFKDVDCRGLECPKPVILTKQALEKTKDSIVISIVDNKIARDNIIRLAEGMKLKTEVREVEGNFQISIDNTAGAYYEATEQVLGGQDLSSDYVLLLRGATLGRGSDELGAMLMKSLLFTVANHDTPPKAVFMLNSGVQLACQGSPVLESLQALADKGTAIISCGTCLDFLKLKEKLAVGRIGNMYDIFDTASKYRTVSV